MLVVAEDPSVRRRVIADLVQLDTDPLEVGTTSAALDLLAKEPTVEVLIAAHDSRGMSGGALCQYVRSHAELASIHTLLIADQAEVHSFCLSGRVADDVLPRIWDASALKSAVRGALRGQARRRLIARRERRHAIDWLAMVLAHEINNPLAAAMANLTLMREKATDPELAELVSESQQMLERIRDSTLAIRSRVALVAEPPGAVDPDELVGALRSRLVRYGRQLTIEIDARAPVNGHMRWGLLVDAADALVQHSLSYCSGAVTVKIHVDKSKLAVIVALAGAGEQDPEIILEPRLMSLNGEPPRFHAGLSALEASFSEAGGQLFARPVTGAWRFGLTIPMEPMPVDDD
ncbi:MAG: hybrid sensor histidine kinase/response regulator [Clostridia bacterium]|nr:hybrid sensor histidine kinase/response regulator [Deltaproteobacteria bacterium]